MTAFLPAPLTAALQRPEGAQWVRCALQVNPFAYFASNDRSAPAIDQETYDRGLVAELVRHEVGLIGLADHWRARGERVAADRGRGSRHNCAARLRGHLV